MRGPPQANTAFPAGVISAKGEINLINARNVGRNARLTNVGGVSRRRDLAPGSGARRTPRAGTVIQGSFNNSSYIAYRRKRDPAVVSFGLCSSDSDNELPDPLPLKRKYGKEPTKTPARPREAVESEDDDDDDVEEQPRVATRCRRAPGPEISPPSPRVRENVKAIRRSLHSISSDTDTPCASTTRSPSLFARPRRTYTSTAHWEPPRGAPRKRSFAFDPDKESRPHASQHKSRAVSSELDADDDATPRARAGRTTPHRLPTPFSPATEPLDHRVRKPPCRAAHIPGSGPVRRARAGVREGAEGAAAALRRRRTSCGRVETPLG